MNPELDEYWKKKIYLGKRISRNQVLWGLIAVVLVITFVSFDWDYVWGRRDYKCDPIPFRVICEKHD